MSKALDWCMDRFVDYKVKDYLETRVQRGMMIGGRQRVSLIPETVTVIAMAVGMSNRRVTGCLERLKRKQKVSNVHGDYWKLNILRPISALEIKAGGHGRP